MAADYDKSEVTDREKKAAKRQNALATFNAKATQKQLKNQLATYDKADQQNRNLRDRELTQYARKSEVDRFQAQRNLQNAALSLFGSMNQAMNGSSVGNLMDMLSDRNDSDNVTYWNELQENRNQARNKYRESLNQNNASRLDAINSASKTVSDIMGDRSANLNNINPELYEKPSGNKALNKIQKQINAQRKKVKLTDASASGYVMPSNAEQKVTGKRNKLRGGDYYSKLINGFNGR